MSGSDVGFVEGLAPLGALGEMSKDDFAANRAMIDAAIMDPTRALVESVGARLAAEVSPTLQAVPKVNGSISPLNRDLRFAADRTRPYKDHLLINFWDGAPKRSAPTMRVRLAADGIGFAAGAAFDRDGLEAWRASLCSSRGSDLTAELAALGERRQLRRSEPDLAKTPRGYVPIDDVAAELLRHKTIQFRFLEAVPDCVSTPRFPDWVADRLVELGGVHRWLIETLR